jgi:hypothetical protein
VQTGARCNDWGFYPPGKPFVPWRQFVQHTTVVGGSVTSTLLKTTGPIDVSKGLGPSGGIA